MPSAHWIVFGDVHNSTKKLTGISGLKESSGVILSGDLTFAGGKSDAQKVLGAIEQLAPVAGAQIGNMDKADVNALLEEKGINLHRRAIKLHPSLTLIGVGGSNKTPFNTPSEFSEEAIADYLNEALAMAGSYERLVLISHTPPLDTICDALAGGGHAGSRAVRDFIEKVQPDLCICGHIHEAMGMDMLASTPVINPGAFSAGGYVKISLENGQLESALLVAE